jgi:polysaccharide export outer membrane protein
MFHPGKSRLFAGLAAMLAFGLGSAGCELDGTGPIIYGNGGGCATCQQGSSSGYLPAGPSGSAAGNGYLPSAVQQTAYQGYDVNGGPTPGSPPAGGPIPGGPGCSGPGCGQGGPDGGPGPVPTEKQRTSLPPYTVAPPDILLIDSGRLIPKPPYRLEPLEVLIIQVTDTLPNQPITGPFVVTPEGTVNLGYSYGTLRVQGLTVEQIQKAIREHLSNVLRNPQVSVSLGAFRGLQQTRGEHLVRPDGTINLGTYGCVYVAGMTLGQIKCVIEKHLSDYVINPQVSVDVYSYNSQYYYVVFDGGGFGQQIYKLPITGNETVLDAIATVYGMPPVSSQWRVWVARPAPCGHPCDQILMVDWQAVVKGGSTCTNYQLFPGDRVYVDADCFIKLDNWIAKVVAPFERVLGVALLYGSVQNTFRNNNNGTAFVVPAIR